ncbi:MAG: DUF2059 domain-containing protein [Prevotellaceae bacterium]|jgi:hypothetical protein|nr:DUF2059 domain-containing protein [Prevotellaceae bacterium]
MQSEKMIDNMMDGIIPAMKQQAGTQIQGTDAKQKLDQYMDFVMSETKNLSKKIINEEMPAIYDKFFTHEDIKDLIKFYESPTGKKMLEKTPEITANLMNSMMVKYLPDFQQKVTEKMNDFK